MSDTPPPSSSTEKAIGDTHAQLCRIWTFTYLSIGLNVVILALFLICAIMHHHGHHKHHGFSDRGGRGGYYGMDRGGYGPGFRHDGGMGRGWGGPGGFGGPGAQDGGPGPDLGGRGPGMWGDNPGMMGGGAPGMRGMMGGDKSGPPDPARMTDMVLNRLSTKLNLTDEEKAKIKPIIQDQVTQMQKDMETQRQARQKAIEDAKAKIKALLTADQQKQLDAMPLPGTKPPGGAPPEPEPAAN